MAKAKTPTDEVAEEIVTTTPETVVTETADEPAVEQAAPETFTKSGKRSKKHVEEVAAEEARQERITSEREEAPEIKKGPRPVTRTILERRSKKYQEAAKKIETGKIYSLADALKLAIETSPVKFDASVEIHTRLTVDPRQADQNIRSTVVLPNGSGKTIRVAVFAPADVAKAAKAAGADIADDEDFLKQLDKGVIDFDILISTPAYMPKLGKYARVLGPKGLMPNPKAGTVTNDIEKAVKEAKAGKIEYRVDKQSIIHVSVGKVSFGADKLLENADAYLASLKGQKPASIKGQYVKSIFVTTTMGPSIAVENIYN
jgi:large subunit ribosomal protein L1